MTKLLLAAVNVDYEEVRRLVEEGADVNIGCDDDGNTALMRAAKYGHKDVVMYLHQEWVDILEKSFFATVTSHKTVIFTGSL